MKALNPYIAPPYASFEITLFDLISELFISNTSVSMYIAAAPAVFVPLTILN